MKSYLQLTNRLVSFFLAILTILFTACGGPENVDFPQMMEDVQAEMDEENEIEDVVEELVYTEQSVGAARKMIFTAPFIVVKQDIPAQAGLDTIDFKQCSKDEVDYTIDFAATASVLNEAYEYDLQSGIDAAVGALVNNPNIANVTQGEAKDIVVGDMNGKEISGQYLLIDDSTVKFRVLVFAEGQNIYQVIGQWKGDVESQISSTIESIKFE